MPQGGAPVPIEMSGNAMYGVSPRRVICQFCGADVSTKIDKETGLFTHVAAVTLCIVCCCLAPLPYVTDAAKDTKHSCPNCGKELGRKTVL